MVGAVCDHLSRHCRAGREWDQWPPQALPVTVYSGILLSHPPQWPSGLGSPEAAEIDSHPYCAGNPFLWCVLLPLSAISRSALASVFSHRNLTQSRLQKIILLKGPRVLLGRWQRSLACSADPVNPLLIDMPGSTTSSAHSNTKCLIWELLQCSSTG